VATFLSYVISVIACVSADSQAIRLVAVNDPSVEIFDRYMLIYRVSCCYEHCA